MSQIKIGLVGGSGLGTALAETTSGQSHRIETPFGLPSDAIVESSWSDVPIFFLNRHGPGHLRNPSQVNYRANIFALKQLGCTHILASGAVGSLREEIKPCDMVVVDQVIDKTHRRVGTFFENAAVHVEFAEPFCPILRQTIMDAAAESAPAHSVHPRGTYVCMEGPAFSSRAESLMHRLWGGDLVGMTAMPEAKLAREAEISYAMIALVTDYDCWKPQADPACAATDPFKLLKEIIGNLKDASINAKSLMQKAVELIARNPDRLGNCPAHHALQLGIWSDKEKIHPEEKQRLSPLWMKYF